MEKGYREENYKMEREKQTETEMESILEEKARST